MKRICQVTVVVAVLFAALQAAAVVYLKPIGENETRTTIDGSSWECAFTNLGDAIAAAVNESEPVIYAAKGVYIITAKQTVANLSSFAIYGGFAGDRIETLEERDLTGNWTVFSGDINSDSYWTHYELVDDVVKETKRTDLPAINEAGKVEPPPYTGDFDIYAIVTDNVNGDTAGCFEFNTIPAVAVDGITFVGFYQGYGGSRAIEFVGVPAARVANCRLYGFDANGSISADGKSVMTIANSHFAYSKGGSALYSFPKLYISGSVFESLYSIDGNRSDALYAYGGYVEADDCVFLRNGKYVSWIGTSYYGPGVLFSSENTKEFRYFRNCVASNCYGVVQKNISGIKGAMQIINTNGTLTFEQCVLTNNYCSMPTMPGYSYTMFGNQQQIGNGKPVYRGCVFSGNRIVASATTALAGDSFALGIAGSLSANKNGGITTFENCVFDHNSVEDVTGSVAKAVKSQGVLVAALSNGGSRHSVINCTFFSSGDKDLGDIAVYGSGEGYPINVVNSLFMSDGEVATPFVRAANASESMPINVWCCTAKNVFSAPDIVVDGGEWRYDPVPLRRTASGCLQPEVLTPGLRIAADVAVTTNKIDSNNPMNFRFRPPQAQVYSPLNADALIGDNPELIGDMVDDTSRPEGAFTRGAMQALTENGEEGFALVLRRSPFNAGTFVEGPAVQSVLPGETAVPVRAVASDGATFVGYFTEDGELYSSDAKLQVANMSSALLLTARFATDKVAITFDLQGGGTFSENGSSSITVEAYAGAEFPAVPEYALNGSYVVKDWEGVSAFVPFGMQTITVKAALETTVPQVFCVVPSGTGSRGDGSGRGWENATDDLGAAIIKAIDCYRGELWLKEGVYLVTNSFVVRSNVGIHGGFDGTENERSQADPNQRVTVLTGDIYKDGNPADSTNGALADKCQYWKPENTAPADRAQRRRVYDYERRELVVPPESETWNNYSINVNSGCGDYAFKCESSDPCTNFVISGITFVGFKSGAINFSTSGHHELSVENCEFLACGHYDKGGWAVSLGGSLDIRNSRVAFCQGGISVNDRYSQTSCGNSRFENVVIEDSKIGDPGKVLLQIRNYAEGAYVVTNCLFRRNISHRVCEMFAFQRSPVARLVDCSFEDNRILTSENGNGIYIASAADEIEVLRCRFIGNSLAKSNVSDGSNTRDWNVLSFRKQGPGWTVWGSVARDCFFAGNSISTVDDGHNSAIVGEVQGDDVCGYKVILINCTFVTNTVQTAGAMARAATLMMPKSNNSTFSAIHCGFYENKLQAASGIAADMLQLDREKVDSDQDRATDTENFSIVNCAFGNASAGYRPFIRNRTSPFAIMGVICCGLDKTMLERDESASAKSFVFAETVLDECPEFHRKVLTGANGAMAMAVGAATSAAKVGHPVFISDDRQVYFYSTASNCWRKLFWLKDTVGDKEVADKGLSQDTAQFVDAFGKPRDPKKIAAGALNPVASPLIMRLR